MPESKSKRNKYQPPPKPKPKPSPVWYGPVVMSMLGLALVYLLLYYANLLPWGGPDGLGNYNLLVGFVPLVVGLILLTRWR